MNRAEIKLRATGDARCAEARRVVRDFHRRVGVRGKGCESAACPKTIGRFRCQLAPIKRYPLVVSCTSRKPKGTVGAYGPPEGAAKQVGPERAAPVAAGGGGGLVLPFPRGVRFAGGGCGGSFFRQGFHRYYAGAWGDDTYGVDFGVCGAGDFGTPILAAHGGRVVRSTFNSAYGWTMVIESSPCGVATRYAHLNGPLPIGEGATVQAGQQIGTLGHSGTGGGARSNAHLHFVAYSSCRQGAGMNPSPIGGYNLCAGCYVTSTTDPPGPPDFQASLQSQFPIDGNGSLHVSPGDSVPFGFDLAFNQPYSPSFVLRPDPATVDTISRFVRFPNGQSGSADFPGAPDGPRYRATASVPLGTCPGHYFVRWLAINAATGQFGGLLPSFYVTVDPVGYPPPASGAPAYDAQVVSQSFPRVIEPGQPAQVELRIRNTGFETWDSNVHLATPDDSPIRYGTTGVIGGGQNRVGFADTGCNGSVSPGEVATFRYTVQGPAGEAHAFRQRFELIRDGSGPRFAGIRGIYVPTVIADETHFPPELGVSDCTWTFVSQAGSPSEAGRVVVTNTVDGQWSFTIRNTSDLCPWFPSGSAAFHLATVRPTDRTSGFYDSATWLTPNRIAIPTLVAPGDSVTIPFELHAAGFVGNGDYNEHFAPVIDGGPGHLTDIGMFVPVRKR